jgi:hypothetical protein
MSTNATAIQVREIHSAEGNRLRLANGMPVKSGMLILTVNREWITWKGQPGVLRAIRDEWDNQSQSIADGGWEIVNPNAIPKTPPAASAEDYASRVAAAEDRVASRTADLSAAITRSGSVRFVVDDIGDNDGLSVVVLRGIRNDGSQVKIAKWTGESKENNANAMTNCKRMVNNATTQTILIP